MSGFRSQAFGLELESIPPALWFPHYTASFPSSPACREQRAELLSFHTRRSQYRVHVYTGLALFLWRIPIHGIDSIHFHFLYNFRLELSLLLAQGQILEGSAQCPVMLSFSPPRRPAEAYNRHSLKPVN